ncbi:MAG TPA: hypothetical protein PKB11_02120 [Desulfovibrio sp.]|nr:hypothetical protein [Desulfovibrio sp.]HMM37529.1 hypothetical protein [Desulfovibrio sp.]
MRRVLLLLLLAMLAWPGASAAEPVLRLLFTGNSFGEVHPCPS